MTILIPVLGDQLSLGVSSLQGVDPADARILMMEVAEETGYVRHHKRKIAFILSAMRHHAARLRDAGWQVDYIKLDDPDNQGSFSAELARAVQRHQPSRIRVTEAGEWRVRGDMARWQAALGIAVEICPDTRFIAPPGFFANWAAGRKQLRMEYFYREMRRLTGLLMDGDQPAGGQWNYDAENRKPAEAGLFIPRRMGTPPDAITQDVLALVAERFDNYPGSLDGFDMAVTPEGAEAEAARFLKDALPGFGDYQDAMLTGQPLLWHSFLSPYLNIGLLDPLALCRAVEAEWKAGRVPINAAEGFIRQIIGWRDYVRGLYDWAGPDYAQRNFLEAKRPLPDFYWTGKTNMACLANAIGQTLDLGYAHHIQRLMVTGNYAMLAGIDPHEVHLWYLAIYVDAFEWVELPNTLGMSQFGDGGIMASKPYAASGAYIDRMSDYCRGCTYDVRAKTGPKACPLNALYWDFMDRNRDKLANNPRIGMAYRTWDKMAEDQRRALKASAAAHLAKLDAGDPAV
ncbi:MAG: cryptochrome/photolyase family protein [Sphingomonadaceae bacterium]|jgi:deoxyribodipyrimidine photolyase-related protein|nr:cryptochrome/photolyase family protein [Sphingomonadaceae bacterium]NBU78803.1 cryptochrome/photolyase family protein [Sphingomonadaceae bacterium]NCA00678.1 cryptochrome/photolyase family protein [Sphingomonadaceae bacterium]